MHLESTLKTMRPSFLILTPVCVFLGLSTALASGAQVNLFEFFLILIGAIAAHISVNTLNEFYDFKSGLDFKTDKTAFSGGSGALVKHPEMASTAFALGLISLIITIVIGIYLIFEHGPQILPFGILGVILIITYTKWLNRFPFLCLIAPGLGFGVLMVVGTHVILKGEHSLLPWLVSLIPFFLINNLLLLNQYPDIKADASVGRSTFPIAYGINKSNLVYALFLLAAYSCILIGILKGILPSLSTVAIIPIIFSAYAFVGANKYTSKIGEFPRYLATNVTAAILSPLLLAASILSTQ